MTKPNYTPEDATPDPDLYRTLPTEVTEAARLLSSWFKEQGIDRWCLYDVCSRNHADKLNNIKKLTRWP